MDNSKASFCSPGSSTLFFSLTVGRHITPANLDGPLLMAPRPKKSEHVMRNEIKLFLIWKLEVTKRVRKMSPSIYDFYPKRLFTDLIGRSTRRRKALEQHNTHSHNEATQQTCLKNRPRVPPKNSIVTSTSCVCLPEELNSGLAESSISSVLQLWCGF